MSNLRNGHVALLNLGVKGHSPGNSLLLQDRGRVLDPGGGGGGTASLKVGTHCQTTALVFWRCPPIGGHRKVFL